MSYTQLITGLRKWKWKMFASSSSSSAASAFPPFGFSCFGVCREISRYRYGFCYRNSTKHSFGQKKSQSSQAPPPTLSPHASGRRESERRNHSAGERERKQRENQRRTAAAAGAASGCAHTRVCGWDKARSSVVTVGNIIKVIRISCWGVHVV